NIISIDKRYELTSGMPQTEITRGTHSPVFVSRVFEILDLARITMHITRRTVTAAMGRAVIYKQQLPFVERLLEDTFYRLLEESLGIKKDRYHGYHRRLAGNNRTPCVVVGDC